MTDLDKKQIQRIKWREQKRAWLARMTPEERREKQDRDTAAKRARQSTPDGREKRRRQDESWRARNPDRVAAMRERQKEKKRAETQAKHADPAYIEEQARKKAEREWKANRELVIKGIRAEDARLRREERQAAAALAKDAKKEKEKVSREDLLRRRREERVKKQREIAAKEKAERELKQITKEPVVDRPKQNTNGFRPRMGRLRALSKWHGL